MRLINFSVLLLLISGLISCFNDKSSSKSKIKNVMISSFEKNNNSTATYDEAIQFYLDLDNKYPIIQVREFGSTDIGLPLHEVVLSKSQVFEPNKIRESGKSILFINNAIHPGEPTGVDASMILARNILENEDLQSLLENVVVVIVPIYNIGGALNRNSHTRANQNGPESYGFRGNARNLDLNRDFIKCDSKNAQSFNQLFNKWNPDVLIDNHTSNGADYQYTMTLIATQKDKLAPELSDFMENEMLPVLYDKMEEANWEMTPYVFARNTPDEGIAGFLDLPRYSSGYGAVHHTISFMPETHMLKPYSDRVHSTYAFMHSMLSFLHDQYSHLIQARKAAIEAFKKRDTVSLNWAIDFSKIDSLVFKGYEAKYKPSAVTGQARLYYDRSAPYERTIPFYNTYKSTLNIKVPKAYVISQAYSEVIERLKWNRVKVERLEQDSTLEVEMYYIKSFDTSEDAYEGHYLHRNMRVEAKPMSWKYRKGDYLVKTDQDQKRYIVETLEPQAPDSYFAWNFFDGILMQKEYFSAYVFEDLAEEILKNNAALNEDFQKKKKEDKEFAQNARAQLRYIYENSPHYEKTHRLYPVGRIL